MKRWILILLAFGIAGFWSTVQAEDSIIASDVKVTCSLNNFFCVSSDPESQKTTVYRRRAGGVQETLWSMKGYFPVVFLSNDGESLVAGYFAGSVLPENYQRNQVMISFYLRDKLVSQVHLSDIIPEPSKMPKVNNQYHWGSLLGLNANDHLTVQKFDQSWILYDAKSGKPIK